MLLYNNNNIYHKYNRSFNFFFAKPINEIVQNQIYLSSTIAYKEAIAFSQNNQCLKRLYFLNNSYNRNQIQDRIAMLAQFYDATYLVKYQYPTMILSSTKDIFLKRIRRLKKMSAADCSSQQSSPEIQGESYQSFQSSGFLHSIKTEDLAEKSNSMNRSSMSLSSQLQKSAYDIYYHEENLNETLFRPKYQTVKIQFSPEECSEELISHLICDMDQFDKQKTIKLFKRIKYEDSLIIDLESQKVKESSRSAMKTSKIKITPLDFNPEQKNKQNEERLKLSRVFKKQLSNKRSNFQASIYENYRLKNQFWGNYQGYETERQKTNQYFPERLETQKRFYNGNIKTLQNSNHKSIHKYKKRQLIERAAALLQRVKSDDNLFRQNNFPRKSYMKDYYPYH